VRQFSSSSVWVGEFARRKRSAPGNTGRSREVTARGHRNGCPASARTNGWKPGWSLGHTAVAQLMARVECFSPNAQVIGEPSFSVTHQLNYPQLAQVRPRSSVRLLAINIAHCAPMRRASVRAPVTFMIVIRQFRVTGEICCARRILHAERLSRKVSVSRFVMFCFCICTQRRTYVRENTKRS